MTDSNEMWERTDGEKVIPAVVQAVLAVGCSGKGSNGTNGSKGNSSDSDHFEDGCELII